MAVILKTYNNILTKFPVLSQAVQTGLFMGTGDLVAQIFVEKRSLNKIDFTRTGRFALIGTFFVGPSLRVWYGFIEKHVGSEGKLVVLKKVAYDQFLFAPPFLGAVMTLVGLAKGSSINGVFDRMKHDYPDVLKNNYIIWPAVQLVNFYFVPLQYQVLMVQFVAIFWNTYLSWKMNQDIPVRFVM